MCRFKVWGGGQGNNSVWLLLELKGTHTHTHKRTLAHGHTQELQNKRGNESGAESRSEGRDGERVVRAVMRRTGDREREARWVVIEGEDGLRKEKGVAEKGGLG